MAKRPSDASMTRSRAAKQIGSVAIEDVEIAIGVFQQLSTPLESAFVDAGRGGQAAHAEVGVVGIGLGEE